MNTNDKKQFKTKPVRDLALSLLLSHNGIPSESYFKLTVLLKKEDGNDDIINAVKAVNDDFYLPRWFNNET